MIDFHSTSLIVMRLFQWHLDMKLLYAKSSMISYNALLFSDVKEKTVESLVKSAYATADKKIPMLSYVENCQLLLSCYNRPPYNS